MSKESDIGLKRYEKLSEQSAEDLYDNAPSGYLSTLPDGTIVKVNATLAGWIGYAREELVTARRFRDLLSVPGRIYFETHVAPLLRMQGEVSEIAFDMRCSDGRQLPVLVNCIVKHDLGAGTPIYRMTVFNATSRRQYERELLLARRQAEDAAQAKSDLLAMLGHDIRTPLSAIMNVAHALDATEATAQQRTLFRILRTSSESLLLLINDILDYTRLEAGKMPIEEKPFRIESMMQTLGDAFAGRIAEKDLRLSFDVDPAVPHVVRGDSVKIGQVLSNLIGNAVKFTGQGEIRVGVALVKLEPQCAALRFEVRDTGIGIEHAQLANIFEEFTQASADIGLKYGGTGLGLAICRRLLALLGGEMHVDSTPEIGSSFSFELRLGIGDAGD